MSKHARREMRGCRAQAERTLRIVSLRLTCRVAQAEMNVHAVAGAVSHGHRREDRAMSPAKRHGARHLARNHGMVGSLERRLRCDSEFELARSIFGEERVGRHTCRAKRRDEALAEGTLPAKRIETVSVAGPILYSRIDEFLLEGGDQLEPAHLFECRDRPAQEIARATFPRAAVGVANVAEEEMLDFGAGRALAEIDTDLGGSIGHDHEIPARAERRIEDRTEAGLHQVGMGPADARLAARLELARREALAPHQPGDVASADEKELLAQHCSCLHTVTQGDAIRAEWLAAT